ncbi:hypothetical protein O1611_g1895 [Lasiodiplodia mahajangana]|uniref:Uncharacterized protein n=1 Tax=Lasiodiplodia mahajangana TaxID=1108764 RepID=A0ACC2JWL8_9PEZI|nr:hypothetical protein O1611_g1895 [Lasiodiplodia mahajangana]
MVRSLPTFLFDLKRTKRNEWDQQQLVAMEYLYLERTIEWLAEISQYLRTANDAIYSQGLIMDLVIGRRIVTLWLQVITVLGDQEADEHFYESLMKQVGGTNQEVYHSIKEFVRHDDEKVTKIAERLARAMAKIAVSRNMLSLESRRDGAVLPCNTIPVPENPLFVGQDQALRTLDSELAPRNTPSRLFSVALYGIGGVGKTQLALAYAHLRLKDLDAVFWISAEDPHSVQRSFSRVAVDALRLTKARAGAHEENMALVLNWLRNTSARWLLIFDHMVGDYVFENCWPVSSHGSIIVTTRNAIITPPIDYGIVLHGFSDDDTIHFLEKFGLHGEWTMAKEISSALDWLPLAISQMAALMKARSYLTKDFADIYKEYGHRLHGERTPGWKYLGYEHAIDSVWEASFKSLGKDAHAWLGVSSFMGSDDLIERGQQIKSSKKLPEVLRFLEDRLSMGNALEDLLRHSLVSGGPRSLRLSFSRLVRTECRVRMENAQEYFEATIKILLDWFPFPSGQANKYDDEECKIADSNVFRVLALIKYYEESQSAPQPLELSIDFVSLLVNTANAIHDNDRVNVVPKLLDTAASVFPKCREQDGGELVWAHLLSVRGMYHLATAEFVKSEEELTECLNIRSRLLPRDDFLMCLAFSRLGMAVGSQGRYQEGLDLLLKAGKALEGPAEEIPTMKQVWCYHIARNYYCMGKYEEAERVLRAALEEAEGWYQKAYGHLTFASLWTRMGRLDDAKESVQTAHKIVSVYSVYHWHAKGSWLNSYCAYRGGVVAMLQGRIKHAIIMTGDAVSYGKTSNVPIGILSRYTHAFSEALAMDPAQHDESEIQRLEARRLRSRMPGGGGDLDDESDAAFEKLVMMDHRLENSTKGTEWASHSRVALHITLGNIRLLYASSLHAQEVAELAGGVVSLQAALASVTNEVTVAAANLNFDFTLVKCEAPKEYQSIGQSLTPYRKAEAEGGSQHVTARRLGALFEGVCPKVPNLLGAFGTRAAEIAQDSSTHSQYKPTENWIFSDYTGIDSTSLWAAATSSKAALPVYLLACMLARAWGDADATSLWVEIVAERRRDIAARYQNEEEMPFATAMAAAQAEITRDQLAKWDASARAWLQTADKSRFKQRKQFLLIANNIDIPISNESRTFDSIVVAWTTALEAMEKLIMGEPLAVKNGSILLGISAWHIYPDMDVFSGKDGSKSIDMKDPLVHPGGVVSLGLLDSTLRASQGVYWSLALANHRFYGRAVKKTSQLNGDESRLTFNELQIVTIGVILTKWKIRPSDIFPTLEFLHKFFSLVPYDPSKYTHGWISMLNTLISYCLQNQASATPLISLGQRRGDFIPSALGAEQSLFGLTDLSTILDLIETPSNRIELLRRLASRVADLEDVEAYIRYRDSGEWCYATVFQILTGGDGQPTFGNRTSPASHSRSIRSEKCHYRWTDSRDSIGHTLPPEKLRSARDTPLKWRGDIGFYSSPEKKHSFLFGNFDSAAVFTLGGMSEAVRQSLVPSVEYDDVLWCIEYGLLSPSKVLSFLNSRQSTIIDHLLALDLVSRIYGPLSKEGATISSRILRAPFRFAFIEGWGQMPDPEYQTDTLEDMRGRRMAAFHTVSRVASLALIAYFETGFEILTSTSQLDEYQILDPRQPEARDIDHGSFRRVIGEFDGAPVDHFKNTTLHLSFTEWFAPLYSSSAVGQRDSEAVHAEAVVSVRDRGSWVADISILGAFGHPDVQELPTLGAPCNHPKPSKPPAGALSLETWDQVLDCPVGVVVTRSFKNWIARIAIVAILAQHCSLGKLNTANREMRGTAR